MLPKAMVGWERARIAPGYSKAHLRVRWLMSSRVSFATSDGVKRALSKPQPKATGDCASAVAMAPVADAPVGAVAPGPGAVHRGALGAAWLASSFSPPRYSATCWRAVGVSAAPCSFIKPVLSADRMDAGAIICRNIFCGALGTWP